MQRPEETAETIASMVRALEDEQRTRARKPFMRSTEQPGKRTPSPAAHAKRVRERKAAKASRKRNRRR